MPPSSVSVELKKQVKTASDIADVISAYIPVSPAGKTFKSLCPFHNDTRPSLQIDRQFQNYRCWACDARGDVFDFVMKFEKVDFPEALRILAARAGIKLDPETLSPADRHRAYLLHVMRWAEEQYRECLLNDAGAEVARTYLGGRRLSGATVRQFGLGFAPPAGDWLVTRAAAEQLPPDLLVETGLIGARAEGRGFYDRFRDRVMFPIRDVRGQTVGFGGRVLPTSPLAGRGPKYYNSAETPLFSKSNLLYGLDLARHAGGAAGYLAVVEGYTDVMMAHQCGVANVVATMGTALNGGHVGQLRRYAPKVVLVYDADDGGLTGVDRALELFIGQDVDLAVAALPDGLDPCDLLVQPGGEELFRSALANAADALEFKLDQLLRRESATGVDGSRRVIDAILGVMALAPPVPNQAGQVRQELIVTRLAQRLGVRQETVWARFGELKAARRVQQQQAAPARPAAVQTSVPRAPAGGPAGGGEVAAAPKAGRAEKAERQLLEMLLADPDLVPAARTQVAAEAVTHTGLRRLLSELYALADAGHPADLDGLRVRLLDRPDLVDAAGRLQDVGRGMTDRPAWLARVLAFFVEQRGEADRRSAKDRLTGGAMGDDETAAVLLRFMGRGTPPGPDGA